MGFKEKGFNPEIEEESKEEFGKELNEESIDIFPIQM